MSKRKAEQESDIASHLGHERIQVVEVVFLGQDGPGSKVKVRFSEVFVLALVNIFPANADQHILARNWAIIFL